MSEASIAKAKITNTRQRAEKRMEADQLARDAARSWGALMASADRSNVIPRQMLAIDPGSVTHGFAVVRATETSEVIFVDAGEIDTPTARRLIGNFGGAVAVERVFFQPLLRNVAALLETARAEADLCAESRIRRGIPAIALASREVRLGAGLVAAYHGSADDKAVKAFVERWVRGLPTRTNAHHRDALLLAIAASRLIGPAWFLPKERT